MGQRIDEGLDGLAVYLPEESAGANRDISSMQGSFMRFGAKHNDIFPILADMIRWATGLPSRREPKDADVEAVAEKLLEELGISAQ